MYDLIEKYSTDFSADCEGQLSVTEIVSESVDLFVESIPELAVLSNKRKGQIKGYLIVFGLLYYDEGKISAKGE